MFITAIFKILIANKYLKGKNQTFVNFSSTYDKALRSHKTLEKIFQVVLERNIKVITKTEGALGFETRPKRLLNIKSELDKVFEDFVSEYAIHIINSDSLDLKRELVKKNC